MSSPVSSTCAPCPICGASILLRELPQHANNCLDATSTRQSPLEIPSPPVSPPPSPPPSLTSAPRLATEPPLAVSLRAINLHKYAPALSEAGFKSLSDIRAAAPTDARLAEIGLHTMGARRKLLAAISHLQPSPSISCPSVPSPSTPVATTKRKIWDIFTPGYRVPAPVAKRTRPPSPPRPAVWQKYAPAKKRVHAFSHRVPSTSFTVDSFLATGCDVPRSTYFLTHFHSDHYNGLSKSALPPGALVVCTSVTARLVKMQLGVGDAFLKVVPLGKRVEFEDRTRGMEGSVFQQGGKKEEGGGVSAWFFDANHCPGAVVILFYVRHTGRYVLHSGDCRFDAALFSKYQKLADVIREGCLDYLHLDTTYCDPKYVFPCQKDVLQTVVAAARREDARTGGKCIFFFGSYSIGKERVFMAVANALDLNIFATKRKRTILKHLHIDKLTARLSNGPRNARVHVVAMRDLSAVGLRRYASETMFDAGFIGRGLAIAFRPTGWSYHGHGATPQRINRSKDQAVVYDVPYSEHSSYEELREFVKWAKPARLLPTVNARSSDQANKLRALLGHTDKALRYVAVEGRGASL